MALHEGKNGALCHFYWGKRNSKFLILIFRKKFQMSIFQPHELGLFFPLPAATSGSYKHIFPFVYNELTSENCVPSPKFLCYIWKQGGGY